MGLVLRSRLVGSDHRAWHRLWTDDGQRRRVGSYQEVGTNRSTFRCYFAMGKIRGTLCMRSHISVHRATTKYFCNSFVFTTNIEKEGLPRAFTPDLGAGGLRFKSGRPDHSLTELTDILRASYFLFSPSWEYWAKDLIAIGQHGTQAGFQNRACATSARSSRTTPSIRGHLKFGGSAPPGLRRASSG